LQKEPYITTLYCGKSPINRPFACCPAVFAARYSHSYFIHIKSATYCRKSPMNTTLDCGKSPVHTTIYCRKSPRIRSFSCCPAVVAARYSHVSDSYKEPYMLQKEPYKQHYVLRGNPVKRIYSCCPSMCDEELHNQVLTLIFPSYLLHISSICKLYTLRKQHYKQPCILRKEPYKETHFLLLF